LRTLSLTTCGCSFAIECPDDETTAFVNVAFSGLAARPRGASVSTETTSYRVEPAAAPKAYNVRGPDGNVTFVDHVAGLLFHLDKAVTLTLQRRRPDLYFLHAAVVAKGDWVGVVPSPPHTGKSTLTLALLERGFTYLSDELAPMDTRSVSVEPYPRAVCLKSPPPKPFRLPAGTVQTDSRFHVPCGLFAGDFARSPRPVSAFIFLRRSTVVPAEPLQRIGTAAGAARLMANALNALVHPGDGLYAAASLARRVPCFEVDTYDLAAACAAIEELSQRLVTVGG
jgi:hypothetical protein